MAVMLGLDLLSRFAAYGAILVSADCCRLLYLFCRTEESHRVEIMAVVFESFTK
jgi:hypothetical protein